MGLSDEAYRTRPDCYPGRNATEGIPYRVRCTLETSVGRRRVHAQSARPSRTSRYDGPNSLVGLPEHSKVKYSSCSAS